MTPEKFWSHVEKIPGGCWLWRGFIKPSGYGHARFNLPGQPIEKRRVHRIAWTLLRGPIPDGMTLDHLCRVRHCVNPEHLEVVTQAENCLRGNSSPAINARKTHCVRGHRLAGQNLIVALENGRKHRRCLACVSRNKQRKPQRPQQMLLWA
jgi:hypothetical protein